MCFKNRLQRKLIKDLSQNRRGNLRLTVEICQRSRSPPERERDTQRERERQTEKERERESEREIEAVELILPKSMQGFWL